MHESLAPWNASLTLSEHSIIVYALSIAGLAIFASFARSLVSLNEVTPRYRGAAYAGMSITGVAFLSYVLLVIEFSIGYNLRNHHWVPNANSILSWSPRYFDWTVTVPLLVMELLAVATLAGAIERRLRSVGVAAAILMIATGYVGGVVIDSGTNIGALALWGAVSGVFMVLLYVLIIYVVVKGGRDLAGTPAAATMRNAGILLIVTWLAYPIVFGLQGWGHGGAVMTWMQVILCVADVVAKVGFGTMIHKIAKIRSALDIADGKDTLPESIWIASEKLSNSTMPAVPSSAAGRSDSTR